MRVSTDQQSLERQQHLVDDARKAGYYVAGIYQEKASGTIAERPELMRLINELQPGDVIIAEKLDRISRLPLSDAEKLMQKIKEKGAKISVPDLIDFSDIISLNDSALLLWNSVEGKDFTIDDLADILVNNYEIDENTPLPREVALKDAQELVDEWLKAGIMTK